MLEALWRAFFGGLSGDPALIDHVGDQKPVEPAVSVEKPKPLPTPPDYDALRRRAIESARARGLSRPLVTEKKAERITEPSYVLARIEHQVETAKKVTDIATRRRKP